MKRNLDRMMDVKKQQKDQKNRTADQDPDSDVEITMEQPKMMPLDTAKSVFDEGVERHFGGINTKPSVFDRTALFHTNKD